MTTGKGSIRATVLTLVILIAGNVLFGGALSSLYIATVLGEEPAITGITRVMRISWNSQFGKAYRVLWSPDPAGPWDPLGDPVSGTGAEMHSYDDDDYSARRFYRIEVHDITPPGMVPIPGGTYEMGDHFGGDDSSCSLPVHTVRVNSLYMDATEVTNADFCSFLNAWRRAGNIDVIGRTVQSNSDPPVFYAGLRDGYSDNPDILYDAESDTFGVASGREDHPAICIAWHGAAAYCNWRSEQQGFKPCYDAKDWQCDFEAEGYRLPTEAEWEYAARGGLRYSIYPWGDNIDGAKANYADSGDPHDNDWFKGIGAPTTPVGSYPPNGYGLHDMAGNALELCNDPFWGSYYQYCVENAIADNPTGPPWPSHSEAYVHRGGSCLTGPLGLSCSARYGLILTGVSGFRCVRRPTTR